MFCYKIQSYILFSLFLKNIIIKSTIADSMDVVSHGNKDVVMRILIAKVSMSVYIGSIPMKDCVISYDLGRVRSRGSTR